MEQKDIKSSGHSGSDMKKKDQNQQRRDRH